MNNNSELTGGCLGGAIRYEATAHPFAAEYCHCRMCQKGTGSVVVSWMDFRTEQLTWTSGQPTEYASSESAMRGFCSTCGATLTFRSSQHPDYITLSIATLDDPNLVEPTYHIYTESQVKWLHIDDAHERYLQEQVKPS